jgi:hypothetical protein
MAATAGMGVTEIRTPVRAPARAWVSDSVPATPARREGSTTPALACCMRVGAGMCEHLQRVDGGTRDDAVTDEAADSNDDAFPIEFDVPKLSRIRNAISGGGANFSADRKAVDSITEATPNGLEGLQAVIEALHRFKLRAVRTIAEESDVRQFLHIGTVTPSTAMVYEDILPLVPGARIVYASYDTTTLAHVHALSRDAPDGAVAHLHSPFDNPQRILRGAADTLDLAKPITVVLASSLNVVTDEVAQELVDALRDALAPCSYVVMAQTSLDIFAHGTAEVVEVLNTILDEPYIARTEAEIAHHLEGFDLLDPGLVPIEQWRPNGDPPFLPDGQLIPLYGAVGHKP